MHTDLIKFMYVGKNVSQDFFEEIESVIELVGYPEQIMAVPGETTIAWSNTNPDRLLEITFYTKPDVDQWFQKTVYNEEGNMDTESGWVEGRLYKLSEFLKYGGEADEY